MRSITEENQKTYRKMVDVQVVISSSTTTFGRCTIGNSSESSWYDGAYNGGYRAEKPFKRVLLMDFAGGGFRNTGDCFPISADPGPNCKWGIPAAELGKGLSFYSYADDDIPTGTSYKVIYGNSDGGIFYISYTKSSETNYLYPTVKYPSNWAENERLYILYFDIGDVVWLPSGRIIECNLNLRGVETKLESPSLQASEIEVKAYSTLGMNYIDGITKGSRIIYSAGYDGDMTEPRVFYVNAPIKTDSLSLTVTGYDMTDYLNVDFTTRYFDQIRTGWMASRLLLELSDLIEICKPPLSEFGAEFDVSNQPYGTYTSILFEGERVADFLANACNVWNVDGLYTHYVDAGIPLLRMTKADYVETIYESTFSQSFGEFMYNIGNEPKVISRDFIADFETINDFDIRTLTMPVNKMILQSETQLDKRSTKTVGKRYKVQLDDLYGQFLVTSSTTSSIFNDITSEVIIDENNVASIPIVHTPNQVLWGKKILLEEADPYVITKQGSYDCVLKEQNGEYKLWVNGEEIKLGQKAIDRMINRSQTMYSFTWRGDPRMQPMDVLTVNDIEMTVESLTLEHSGGGLLSKVVCRKGRI